MEETNVAPRTFTFGEHSLTVLCRRDHEESAKVTLTLQMTVEEVWDSFWDFGSTDFKRSVPVTEAEPPKAEAADQPNSSSSTRAIQQDTDKTELLGLDVWPAAVRLCEYLSSCPGLVAGVDVAELGAGMGLPGLLCAKLGARTVLSSDYVQEVVAHLHANGGLNALVPPAFTAVRLDWTDLAVLQPQQLHSFRVILVADVLYQSQLVAPLLAAILSLLHPQGVVLLGHLPRRAIIMDKEMHIPTLVDDDEPYHKFRAAAQEAGLHARVLHDGKDSHGHGVEPKQLPLLLAFALEPQHLQALPPVPR